MKCVTPRTHHENRNKICLMCFKKCSYSKNTFTKIVAHGKVEAKIKMYFDYSASDEHLPNSICGTCTKNVYV